jgi:quercetin dioxygenase-like cupin family protein
VTTSSDSPKLPDLWRVRAGESDFYSPEPGLRRRILCHNANLMLVEHRMEAGWKGARHAHPQDQMVYVISGRLRFQCGGAQNAPFEIGAGDNFIVRGGVEHEASALEACVVLDVFHPTRPDYVPKA